MPGSSSTSKTRTEVSMQYPCFKKSVPVAGRKRLRPCSRRRRVRGEIPAPGDGEPDFEERPAFVAVPAEMEPPKSLTSP